MCPVKSGICEEVPRGESSNSIWPNEKHTAFLTEIVGSFPYTLLDPVVVNYIMKFLLNGFK